MAQFSQADLGPHRSTNLVIKPRYIKRDFTSPWIDSFILSGVAVILGYRYIPIFEKKDAVWEVSLDLTRFSIEQQVKRKLSSKEMWIVLAQLEE